MLTAALVPQPGVWGPQRWASLPRSLARPTLRSPGGLCLPFWVLGPPGRADRSMWPTAKPGQAPHPRCYRVITSPTPSDTLLPLPWARPRDTLGGRDFTSLLTSMHCHSWLGPQHPPTACRGANDLTPMDGRAASITRGAPVSLPVSCHRTSALVGLAVHHSTAHRGD